MAITSYASLLLKNASPYQNIRFQKVALSTERGRLYSFWQISPFSGVTPTTAVVPGLTTTGNLQGLVNGSVQRISELNHYAADGSGGSWLIDRLSHQGGLSGTVTTAQSTNLPTAALTKYTTGEGVMIGLNIYTTIGTTATTVTASYTNQAGTASRTTQPTVIGGTGFRLIHRFIILPLQQGDTGVRSVESVTVLATTGTAGNFGVTLFKPLILLPAVMGTNMIWNPAFGGGCQFTQIVDDAHIHWIFMEENTFSSPHHSSQEFRIIDE